MGGFYLVALVISWVIAVRIAVPHAREIFVGKLPVGFVLGASIAIWVFAIFAIVDDSWLSNPDAIGMKFAVLTFLGIQFSPIPGLITVLVLLRKPTQSTPNENQHSPDAANNVNRQP